MVGGNGPKVTWRLAARHADELNLDGCRRPRWRTPCPPSARDARRSAATRGRSRSRSTCGGTNKVTGGSSASTGWPGSARLGVSRVMGLVRTMTTDDEALGSYIEDARAAGIEVG